MQKSTPTGLTLALVTVLGSLTSGCIIDARGSAQSPPPTPTAAAPTVARLDPRGFIQLPKPVEFETGSDRLRPSSDEVLKVVKVYLDVKKDLTLLRIEGHTDSDGRPDDNQVLSEKRAMAVARWLIAHGIACDRLLPVGFGQSKPLADNATEAGKAQNRRTSFVPAALKGRAIDGMPVDGGGKSAGNACR